MDILSINKIVECFRLWAEAKAPMINSFGYGPISEFGTWKNTEYPVMWIDHTESSSYTLMNKNIQPTFGFNVFFFDQINIQTPMTNENGNSTDNRDHIISDTEQLSRDLLSDLQTTFAKLGIQAGEVTASRPVTDETPDRIWGWQLSLNLKIKHYNCVSSGVVLPSSCRPAYVKNSNNTFSLSIPSGVTDTLPDSIITINNDSINLPATNDITINIKNNSGNDVGELTIDNTFIIDDTILTVNDTIIKSIDAEDAFEFNVKLDGVDSGSWNESTNTWEVESIPCADAIVTLDSEPFLSLDAGSTTNVTIEDEDGNSINPIGNDGTTIIVPNTSGNWVRPSQWLPLDNVSNGTNKFSGLFAVYENRVNVCTMQIFTGSHTINWGDGTTQTTTNGVLYTKTYNYATLAGPILVDEWGFNYKMVVVNAGLVGSTGIYIDRNYVGGQNARTLGWLDIAIDCSTMQEIFVSTNISDGRAHMLQRLLVYDLANNMSSLQLANCINLRVFKFPFNKLTTSAAVNFSNTFFNTTDENNLPLSINTNFANLNLSGTRIIKLGNLTLPNVTVSTQNFMLGSYNINEIGNITIPLVQTIQNFQFGNYSLVKQGVLNTTTALTNINNAWYECRNLREIVLTQCSNVTVVGQAFFGTTSLEKLILPGLRIGFNIAQSTLSATALNDLFTSLGTASGSQTITITGNPGAPTCNTSIATSKGFTVII